MRCPPPHHRYIEGQTSVTLPSIPSYRFSPERFSDSLLSCTDIICFKHCLRTSIYHSFCLILWFFIILQPGSQRVDIPFRVEQVMKVFVFPFAEISMSNFRLPHILVGGGGREVGRVYRVLLSLERLEHRVYCSLSHSDLPLLTPGWVMSWCPLRNQDLGLRRHWYHCEGWTGFR